MRNFCSARWFVNALSYFLYYYILTLFRMCMCVCAFTESTQPRITTEGLVLGLLSLRNLICCERNVSGFQLLIRNWRKQVMFGLNPYTTSTLKNVIYVIIDLREFRFSGFGFVLAVLRLNIVIFSISDDFRLPFILPMKYLFDCRNVNFTFCWEQVEARAYDASSAKAWSLNGCQCQQQIYVALLIY